MSYADVTLVSERTPQVRDAIIAAAAVNSVTDVTEAHLAAITRLNLRAKGITALKSGDFSGMTGLTSLNLYGNELSSLPNGIFEGLTALTTLRLGGNTVDPLPISVSLEKTDDGQFKAVVPTGALFDIVLPISATNGSVADSVTSLTISRGSTESNAVTVSRTANTTAAVTANIGTFPSLPQNHYGYTLSKSSALPVEIISEVIATAVVPIIPETELVEAETPTNTAPTFTEDIFAIRSVTENTAADVNIGTAIAATDANNDTLTYTLIGRDAASFSIDSSSGQLQTKTALDYETKRIYVVSITTSDSSLSDTITVIISIIDVNDTLLVTTTIPIGARTPQVRDAIIAAIPGITSADAVTDAHLATLTTLNLRSAGISELKSGDFSGLTALTNLNLYGNMLSNLPNGIFYGLTSLTTLRLGGNLVEPMPLPVSLQQVGDSEFQAIIRTSAPFDVVLPVNVTISGGTTLVTIPKGSVTSSSFTDVGTPSIGALPVLPANHFGYTFAKSTACNRTSQVRDAIAQSVLGVNNCSDITDIDLARITVLTLENMSITSLKSDDFSGLLSLTMLSVNNNELTSLPNGIFEDLTALTAMHLGGNAVDPLPLTISLQKIGENQIKAIVPSGVPFTIMLPVIIRTGGVTTSSDTLTIPQGKSESELQTITRPVGTIAAVTVDIGNPLPNLPSTHSGYTLEKPNGLPLEIFKRINVAPVFTDGDSTTRTVAENTATDTNIGTAIAATDANNDVLTYTLSGEDAASFSIVSTSGQLQTKASLDYETKNVYTVTITVSDGGLLIDTITVTINVTDVDENRAPMFTDGESTTREIAENIEAGENIGNAIAAIDANNDTLTYALGGTDAAAFNIVSTSGQLQTKAALDFETKNSYSVTITVSDGNLTDMISVTINVTDVDENRAPVFTDGDITTRSIAEDTATDENIGKPVAATDTDDDTLTYTLSGTDAPDFAIDTNSGQLKTSAALDFETKNSYSVTITVSDGKLRNSITVTINVTDIDEKPPKEEIVVTTNDDTQTTDAVVKDVPPNNAPMFTDGDSTTRSITENTGAGLDIGSAVSATDADDDTLTYSLDGTDAVVFSIDTSSGQLHTSASLDYETKSSYSVTITVSDGKGGSDSISVTINVIDVDETPANSAPEFTAGTSTTLSVTENTGSGVNIGSAITAIDTDDDTLTYSLGGTHSASFSIDSTNGQLRTSDTLDYETQTSYSVTITVSDGNGGSDSISITINVIDVDEAPANNAPVFADDSVTLTVTEDTGSAVNIGSAITATEADDDTLTYSLSGTDASSFSIDTSSGQLSTSAALDFESKSSYSVTVNVSDGNGGTDSISVTIEVSDVNEAPVFSDGATATRAIAENVPADINIGKAVSAADPDGAILTYTLDSTNAASFSIDAATGQLKTKASLDYETKDSYSVTITVSDGTLTDSITVTINVTNLDETPSNTAPEFTDGTSTTRSIPENTDADSNIGAPIVATDADKNTLAYLLSGTDASSFAIDSTTGQLKTSSGPDISHNCSAHVKNKCK